MRLLVLDAYARPGRDALARAGATPAGELYARLLRRTAPDARVDVARAADPDPGLPAGVDLADYDGAVWTGSSLTLLDEDDPGVRRQVELTRALAAAGVPGFGSCWAVQLAAVAAGGRCGTSARGREFGLARGIELSAEGRRHPLFAGKPPVFDAWASHADEVVQLPSGATLLASNGWSRVQAVAVGAGRADFWAVQYHPEYDAREVAALCRLRADELAAQGRFPDRAAAHRYADDLDALHRDPSRRDLARRLELGSDVLDEGLRTREVRNWLVQRAAPRAAAR